MLFRSAAVIAAIVAVAVVIAAIVAIAIAVTSPIAIRTWVISIAITFWTCVIAHHARVIAFFAINLSTVALGI